jgi:hypothetical protein
MAPGVDQIGLKESLSLQTLLVLILLPLVRMRLIALVDRMTKIAQTVWDAVRKRIEN